MIARIRAWNEDRIIRRAVAQAVHDSYAEEAIGHCLVLEVGGTVRHCFDVDLLDPALAA